MSCTKLTQNYLNVRNDTIKFLGGNIEEQIIP